MIEILEIQTKLISYEEFKDICIRSCKYANPPKYSIGDVVSVSHTDPKESNDKLDCFPMFITEISWRKPLQCWVYSGYTMDSKSVTPECVSGIESYIINKEL